MGILSLCVNAHSNKAFHNTYFKAALQKLYVPTLQIMQLANMYLGKNNDLIEAITTRFDHNDYNI